MTRNKTSVNRVNKMPVKRTNHPPPSSEVKNTSVISNLASSVLQGFTFGTGSAIAHNAVNQVFNKENNVSQNTITSSSETSQSSTNGLKTTNCDKILDLYVKCNYDKPCSSDEECNMLLELYKKCNIHV